MRDLEGWRDKSLIFSKITIGILVEIASEFKDPRILLFDLERRID